MNKIKMHTLELSYTIISKEYEELKKYFYSTKKECYSANKKIEYLGFKDKGIRIQMLAHKPLEEITVCTLKYVITPSRYINKNDYLGLTDIAEVTAILNDIGNWFAGQSNLLPNPLNCRITRADFTRDLYVGDNIDYIIKLLNRCHKPYGYKKNFKNSDNNATFTKYNSTGQKLFELSFYDKLKEMNSHMDNHNYQYDKEILDGARGILRMEFRFYKPRLKNLKKSYPYKTVSDFFYMAEFNIEKIIKKNLRSLYLDGDFYKFNTILDMIDFSTYKDKTKNKMKNFILLATKRKNSDIAAIEFADKYGEKELKTMLRNFNKLGVIPLPISIRQPFDEWRFRE